ncbi:MAG TPA: 4Fe-4S binding protein [Anaerolineae bacterium]|nr:4Fe-4S binding protein [Anaerolineae bacterium]
MNQALGRHQDIGVAYSGIPSLEELRASPGYPRPADLEKGPIGVIECVQEIPCNPCELACRQGAIVVGEPITNLPRFEAERCTGCGLCISICPGQAIFLVHLHYSAEESLVTFPFEYLPLPVVGSQVPAVDRAGAVVCQATVIKVQTPRSFDRTAVVNIAIPQGLAHEVRSIQRPGAAAR